MTRPSESRLHLSRLLRRSFSPTAPCRFCVRENAFPPYIRDLTSHRSHCFSSSCIRQNLEEKKMPFPKGEVDKQRWRDAEFEATESMFKELYNAIGNRDFHTATDILEGWLFAKVVKLQPDRAIDETLEYILDVENVPLLAYILDSYPYDTEEDYGPSSNYRLAHLFRRALVKEARGNEIMTRILKPYDYSEETGEREETIRMVEIVLRAARYHDEVQGWFKFFFGGNSRRQPSKPSNTTNRRKKSPSAQWLATSPMDFEDPDDSEHKPDNEPENMWKDAPHRTPLQWALVRTFLPRIACLLISEGASLSQPPGYKWTKCASIRDHIFIPANIKSADINDSKFEKFLMEAWNADKINHANDRGRIKEWVTSFHSVMTRRLKWSENDEPRYTTKSDPEGNKSFFSRKRLIFSFRYLSYQLVTLYGPRSPPGVDLLSGEVCDIVRNLEDWERSETKGKQAERGKTGPRSEAGSTRGAGTELMG